MMLRPFPIPVNSSNRKDKVAPRRSVPLALVAELIEGLIKRRKDQLSGAVRAGTFSSDLLELIANPSLATGTAKMVERIIGLLPKAAKRQDPNPEEKQAKKNIKNGHRPLRPPAPTPPPTESL